MNINGDTLSSFICISLLFSGFQAFSENLCNAIELGQQ
jgi:hypothetical protein